MKPNEEKELKWEIGRRLEFIEFRLYWEGRINRHDLRTVFNISNPQASADFARYQEIAPANMLYDKKRKFYYASSDFKPAIIRPSSEQFFLRYMSVLIGIIPQQKSFIGFVPPVGNILAPGRRVEPEILRRVIAAIRNKKALEIEYQSMTESGRSRRWISPHALGFDNFRWHCRAFCHIDSKFKDFTLGRIMQIISEKDSEARPQDDKDWETYINVKIGPNPKLDERKKQIIEFEYGMVNGEIDIPVRRSMLLYFINILGLHEDVNETTISKQYVTILNKEEVNQGLKN